MDRFVRTSDRWTDRFASKSVSWMGRFARLLTAEPVGPSRRYKFACVQRMADTLLILGLGKQKKKTKNGYVNIVYILCSTKTVKITLIQIVNIIEIIIYMAFSI